MLFGLILWVVQNVRYLLAICFVKFIIDNYEALNTEMIEIPLGSACLVATVIMLR